MRVKIFSRDQRMHKSSQALTWDDFRFCLTNHLRWLTLTCEQFGPAETSSQFFFKLPITCDTFGIPITWGTTTGWTILNSGKNSQESLIITNKCSFKWKGSFEELQQFVKKYLQLSETKRTTPSGGVKAIENIEGLVVLLLLKVTEMKAYDHN